MLGLATVLDEVDDQACGGGNEENGQGDGPEPAGKGIPDDGPLSAVFWIVEYAAGVFSPIEEGRDGGGEGRDDEGDDEAET